MKVLDKFNKIYYRMLISYILIITISTVIVGITSYSYFSSRFNEEIESINNMMLDSICKSFENDVALRINKLCIDLETYQNKNGNLLYLFNQNNIDSYRIQEIKLILQEIASLNNDLIESISLYNKGAKMIIGSSSGVTYLSDIDSTSLNSTFSKNTLDLNSRFSWIFNDSSTGKFFPYEGPNSLLYIYYYSDYVLNSNNYGFFKININKSLMRNIIKESLPKESVFSFVADDKGALISTIGDPSKHDINKISTHVSNLRNNPEIKNISYIDTVDAIKSVVSINLIEYTNWHIVNVIPLNDYYNKTFLVRRNIAIYSCISIIIGLLLSAIFTSKFNNPVELIIRKAKVLLSNRNFSFDEPKNEFNYIHGVIDNLTNKLSELEVTVKNNIPLIKHNLIVDLVQNNIKDMDEIDVQLDIIGTLFSKKYFNISMLVLDSSAVSLMNAENKQLTKYDLIRYIESSGGLDFVNIAAALSNTEIVIITNTNIEIKIKNIYESFLNRINEYAKTKFSLNTFVIIGGTTENLIKTYELYQTVKTIQKYHFFMPDSAILSNVITDREVTRNELPEKLISNFEVFLNSRNIDGIESLLDSLIEMVQKGEYSYDHCQQKTLEIIYILSKYCKNTGVNLSEDIITSLFAEYYSLQNIKQFKELFIYTVNSTFYMISEHEKRQRHEIMENINKYILDNVNKDISLNIMAERVGLSPNYLSRIYKEDCGITFIEYVMKVKMEKAKELLQSTNLTIEEISQNLGYSGSAYLIKKFRETYGITPSKYRFSI